MFLFHCNYTWVFCAILFSISFKISISELLFRSLQLEIWTIAVCVTWLRQPEPWLVAAYFHTFKYYIANWPKAKLQKMRCASFPIFRLFHYLFLFYYHFALFTFFFLPLFIFFNFSIFWIFSFSIFLIFFSSNFSIFQFLSLSFFQIFLGFYSFIFFSINSIQLHLISFNFFQNISIFF